MIMILQEDIQNLLFKCEKMLETINIKEKRLKKERKNLERALKDFEVDEDNEVVFTEVNNRLDGIALETITIKTDKKDLSKVITKIKPLLNSSEIIEDTETEDIELEDIEIGPLE